MSNETTEVSVEELRVKIREEERKAAESQAKEKLEVWKAEELADLEARQQQLIHEDVEKLVQKYMEEQGPPTADEIQKLLSQEYLEFKVSIRTVVGEADEERVKTIEFVITELPQSVEKQFYKKFKKQIVDLAPQINAWVQKNLDKSVIERVEGFLETVDGGMDLMAEAVVYVLNPRGKKTFITKEWVADNISSIRQWNILQAQADANRLRDFFSLVSRSGREIEMTTKPLSFQQLQEQVRS